MISTAQMEKCLAKEDLDRLHARHRQFWPLFTLADAFKVRVGRNAGASFNDFLAENGIVPSETYASPRRTAIVLWHATLREHLNRILRHGLFSNHGIYFGGPTIGAPFSYAANVPQHARDEDLALLCCIVDSNEYQDGRDYQVGKGCFTFRSRVRPEAIYLGMTAEEVRVVGPSASEPIPVTRGEFIRRGKTWHTPQRTPVRFDADRSFGTPREWVECYVAKLFEGAETVSLFEIISGIYCTAGPKEAIPLELATDVLCRECTMLPGKQKQLYALLRHDHRQ